MTVAWTRWAGRLGGSLPLSCRRHVAPLKRGAPPTPLIITAYCSEPPLLLAILPGHAGVQQCSSAAMLEPLVELMYGTPCAIAKAPRARGSCVSCVWCGYVVVCRRTLSSIVYRLHAAPVIVVGGGGVVVAAGAAGKHVDLRGGYTHTHTHTRSPAASRRNKTNPVQL